MQYAQFLFHSISSLADYRRFLSVYDVEQRGRQCIHQLVFKEIPWVFTKSAFNAHLMQSA